MRHQIDGLLVLPRDVRRLNAALNRLMGDAALRAQFAAPAVEAPTFLRELLHDSSSP